MKQLFLRSSSKKFITAAFITASVLFTNFSSNAAVTNTSNIEILSNDKASVQFTGSTSDALLFKVHLNNDNSDNFTITIKNEDGSVLFSKSFKDLNFDKQFKILKGDNDNSSSRYYFTITSVNKDLEETYVISSAIRTVNDVTVNRL